jgi:uncharacterized membrane protein
MHLHLKHSRHRAFYVAGGIGVVVGIVTAFFAADQALAFGIEAFFVAYVALAFRQLRHMGADYLRKHADEADAPVPVIFGSTALAVCVSVVELFQLINSGQGPDPLRLGIAALSVVFGWFAVNTMVAQHYAYEYYGAPELKAEKGKGSAVAGGFDFPSGKDPDGMSFLYQSYTIAMTAQVSDVAVTSRAMQRIVLIHGIFSFFFNTIIIAAAVNITVSLGGGG